MNENPKDPRIRWHVSPENVARLKTYREEHGFRSWDECFEALLMASDNLAMGEGTAVTRQQVFETKVQTMVESLERMNGILEKVEEEKDSDRVERALTNSETFQE